jgi:hypothetical protein
MLLVLAFAAGALVMLYSGLRLSGFLKPGRTAFKRFPRVLGPDEFGPGGRRWHKLGGRALAVNTVLVVSYVLVEYFVCGTR